MKKLVFKNMLDETTGEMKLQAVEVNVSGLTGDGSIVDMSDSLLNKALESGLFQKRGYGRGYDNTYYKCEELTLLRVRENQIIVIDSYINNNEWIADTFAINKKAVCIKRNNENDRGIPRVSMRSVKHLDKTRENEVISKNYPVALNRVLWDIKLGNISGLKLADNETYDIVNQESHHERAGWDNRLCNTIALTTKEHNDYHSENGEYNRQVKCKITSLEELQAFIEYLRETK